MYILYRHIRNYVNLAVIYTGSYGISTATANVDNFKSIQLTWGWAIFYILVAGILQLLFTYDKQLQCFIIIPCYPLKENILFCLPGFLL